MTDTITAVVLPVIEGDSYTVRVGYPKRGETLPYLQEQVGGWVEAFDLAHPDTGSVATVWLNDEGKINGLPRNQVAEIVALVGGWEGLFHGDWIAGPVVLTGFDPETGETEPLPDEWTKVLAAVAEGVNAVLKQG